MVDCADRPTSVTPGPEGDVGNAPWLDVDVLLLRHGKIVLN